MNQYRGWYFLSWGLVCLVMAAEVASGQSPEVSIGSKAFTESVILGEMAAHLAHNAGAKVQHRAELGGTQILWQALTSGEIDAYVEYTGTIREEILSDATREGVTLDSEQAMRDALAKRGVVMSQRLGFNNTYALGMRRTVADRLNIRSISDLTKHPNLVLGLSDEFVERQDGWHPLKDRYALPQTQLRVMDHNLAYRGLEKDSIQITDLYTTDPEIKYYNLIALEDDLGFFPMYYAVVLMRDDLPT
ncbi:MAG: glycine betaine ABC transporter substrate-binding protein, partial [Planctomycetota bacterium]